MRISVTTLAHNDNGPAEITTLTPEEGESPMLFSFDDPFGLRKAVVPVFSVGADGDLQGMGTAFVADPWGRFITADHVVSHIRRERLKWDGSGRLKANFPDDEGLFVLLGFGIGFGRIGLPPESLGHVNQIWSPGLPVDDPMAALRGDFAHQPIDFSVLNLRSPHPTATRSLLLRSVPSNPRPGELVVAVGYPNIETFKGTVDDARIVISEGGMKAAYGRVVNAYPQGRDAANPTPVFEIEANWPSGMSGGPVFNADGEVIGLVSRSIEPQRAGELGLAWATWLRALSDIPIWIPSLDHANVAWRRGWAALQTNPWKLAGVFGHEDIAGIAAKQAGPTYSVSAGTWRLGSNDFIKDR